ncbi:MAG TPA: Yip1 family protein [Usitatibacteraceae bacterium]|nr:Yip1 family protein [Usitatibacteraceae bacterium]
MGIVDRVKNIILTPKSEWPIIAGETSSTGDLMGGYVAPLAGISVLCGFVGSSIVGVSLPFIGTYRSPILAGIGVAVFSFVMAFVGIFILSLIINALAPTFGGEKNPAQALKVAVYSYTPAWIAGILGIIPALGLIGVLVSLYGLYLLYLGLPRLMKNPEEKSIGYTAVVVICAIVIGFVISLMAGGLAALTGGGAMMGAMHGRSPGMTFDKDSPMGKLEGFGKQMEEAGRKMEAAQKSGDPNAQMKAAMEGLGTVLGGGKRFEPLGIEQLKPLVPERLADLPRTSQSAEKSGMAGLQVSKAEAQYDDGAGRHVDLEVTDTGGAGGLMGLAGWMNIQGEKETDDRIERTRRDGKRMVHEEISKRGGDSEYTVVVGDRFVVSARGQGVPIETLRSAVGSIDLAKLESMKDVGAVK